MGEERTSIYKGYSLRYCRLAGLFIFECVKPYNAEEPMEIDLEPGDIVFLQCAYEKYRDWCLIRKDLSIGFVPKACLKKISCVESVVPGCYDVERKEAEKMLFPASIKSGTYVIRPSSNNEYLALSIKVVKDDKILIKHYRLQMKDNFTRIQFEGGESFEGLKDLIVHYSVDADGLIYRLLTPCPWHPKLPAKFEQLEVDRKSIAFQCKLGCGRFGEVWKCKWDDMINVAVKMLIKPSVGERSVTTEHSKGNHNLNSLQEKSKEKPNQDLLEEAATLFHIGRHDHIMQIFGYCRKPDTEPMLLITELLNGSLLKMLRDDQGEKLDYRALLDIMEQVANGMKHIASLYYIHRDIRASNIFYGSKNLVKIGDFGLAKKVKSADDTFIADCGTRFPTRWTAPEAAMHRTYSLKSDIWSFGVLLYEIFTFGKTPYEEIPPKEIIVEIHNGYRLLKPKSPIGTCPNELYALMRACWHETPKERPDFNQVGQLLFQWQRDFIRKYL